MKAKYKLKNGNVLKDGHTMFLQDVVADLERKSYLEGKVESLTKALQEVKDNDVDYKNCTSLSVWTRSTVNNELSRDV